MHWPPSQFGPNVPAPYLAAVVQAASVAFDPFKTLEKVADLAADIGRQKVSFAVFPEAFVSAYPRGQDFGAYIGTRTAEGREQFRIYWESAIEVPGPAVTFLSRVARENALQLSIGVIERVGGTLYCTNLFFSNDGAWLGKHRKLMPTGSERLVWGFGDGSTLPVFDTSLGKMGAVICWENYMPLLRAAMYGKGIELYCAPTADGRESWLPSMRHIAMEGRCFVLSANQFSRRRDYPCDYSTLMSQDPDAVYSAGGSCIIDPLGNVLTGPHFEGEGIFTAEIDMRMIARAKFDFDPTGHYSRPDVLGLTVNEAEARAVRFVPPPALPISNMPQMHSEQS